MVLTYNLINGGTEYEISKYEGSDATVRIPETYEGKPITSIGDWAFANTSIYNIIFTNKIKTIGERAFYNCTNLNNITILSSVTTIKNYAFYNCVKFTHVFIPSTVTTLGDQIFTGCSNISICCECEAVSKPAGWSNLWNSAGYPVTWNAAKLECSIDFDDGWIQEDCHWKYDRIFTITYKIADDFSFGTNIPEFYYSLGTTEYRAQETTDDTYTEGKLFHKAGTRTWTYELKLSSIDINKLVATRTSEGWLDVSARLSVKDTSGTVHQVSTTYDYYFELPPKPVNTPKTELVTNNPGELKCSWTKAITVDKNAADSVDGYIVELKRCLAASDPTKEENYFYVGNLAWDDTELASGKYKLKLTEDTRDLSVPDIDGSTTYFNEVINTEAYIDGANSTQFYFEPEQLGLQKGDYYKFIIYPHSHYSSEHTLITPDGTESNTREVPKGIVRVFNGTAWVEGEVWVMTENGWRVADSIYIMTDKGWQITA